MRSIMEKTEVDHHLLEIHAYIAYTESIARKSVDLEGKFSHACYCLSGISQLQHKGLTRSDILHILYISTRMYIHEKPT